MLAVAAVALVAAGVARAEVNVDRVSCLGFSNCYRLTNGEVEVVVTTDIGPRIIRYAFVGGENILGELPVKLTDTTRNTWQAWGGHRLWLAPEAKPWSYAPDNAPIKFELLGQRGVRLIRGVEEETGIEKEMIVEVDEGGSGVTVTHRLTNRAAQEVDVSPWALTIMNGGGTVIVPQEPYRSHDDELLPVRPMALWGYTNLADPRWRIGPRFIQLSTDASREEPQKLGVGNRQGWAAYARQGTLFLKRVRYRDGATYPDFGSNFEIYTSANFIELETLGPLERLPAGATAEHVERWYLVRDVRPGNDEQGLHATLTPVLAKAPPPR